MWHVGYETSKPVEAKVHGILGHLLAKEFLTNFRKLALPRGHAIPVRDLPAMPGHAWAVNKAITDRLPPETCSAQ